MIIVKSKNNVSLRLTKERWNHIVLRHPEMDGQREQVLETVTEPDLIQQGDFGEFIAVRFYAKTPLTSKHLVVIYKEVIDTDGFIITAYYATKPSERRKIVWKR
ncbi:MAG: hypothetical protein HZC12_08950 [Nitrospirae bacterium]|nr:hypothetical protein [Nitrospirota bacterium]